MRPLKRIKSSNISEEFILLHRIRGLEKEDLVFCNGILKRDYGILKEKWIKELNDLLEKRNHPDYCKNYYQIIRYADNRMYDKYRTLLIRNYEFRKRRAYSIKKSIKINMTD